MSRSQKKKRKKESRGRRSAAIYYGTAGAAAARTARPVMCPGREIGESTPMASTAVSSWLAMASKEKTDLGPWW